MVNRLSQETSPYLLQHAENPVDWYPWGEEALQASRTEDKPILLSIGYSACHWCHVMAHESFENEAIAQIMNDNFVNIKVDREERPDLDNIYMMAVQMLTGHGGWPMTVFLTPEGKPFYGGTYFPPEDRMTGPQSVMPGFPRVLTSVAEAYRNRRQELESSANQIQQHLNQHFEAAIRPSPLGQPVLDEATRNISAQYDRENGGFGGAPKFPPPMTIEFLFRAWRRTGSQRALDMATTTLDRMAYGGLYDQIGGGFHRYTVDDIWLVPHFEKMLYDNALLARVYALGWQITGKPLYRQVALDTFTYIAREMTSPEGGIYSTQDADSEGEEGKFYVWTPAEIEAVLNEQQARLASAYFGIEPDGNFEGHTVLSVPVEPDLVANDLGVTPEELDKQINEIRQRLYQARADRVWPGRDDKILTSWNGLMLRALAESAVIFDQPELREAAIRNAEFIRDKLVVEGRLQRTWKDGQARQPAFLEDYANLVDGLVSLYEATFDPAWIGWAHDLAETMISEFCDDENGGFFDTGTAHEKLITRPKEVFDSATPSGNSVAAEALIRLALLTAEPDYQRRAIDILEQYGAMAAERPTGFSRLLTAYDFSLAPVREIAVIGDRDDARTIALIDAARQDYRPWKVMAAAEEADTDAAQVVPLLQDRVAINGQPTAYVCQNYICQLPVTEPSALIEQLQHQPG